MKRRRLLFLCQTFPYPPDGGVWIRSYNILRLLAREFEVTMLCFERALSKDDGFSYDQEDQLAAIATLADTEVFRIPQRHSRLRYLMDHIRSVLARRPFTVYLYESADFRRRLKDLLATNDFDLVHVDSMDLSAYLPLLKDVPVICTHHNVESDLLRRRANIEKHPVMRMYVKLQSRFTRAEESTWCDRVALNIAVSVDDASQLQRIAPTARFAVVPNGVDVDHFRPEGSGGGGLVFVGGVNWFPNRDALEYFCQEILPLIRARHPELPVRWVGAAPDKDRVQFQERYQVELTGYVDDVRPLVRGARCYIVPLRVGGGSRLKILDAWAMGSAVVSTSRGCEGLNAIDGKNILIADTSAAFASAIDRILTDDSLRDSLGDNGRATAVAEYSWDAIGQKVQSLYAATMTAARDGVAESETTGVHMS